MDMNKAYDKFRKSKEKVLIVKRHASEGVVTQWRKVRNPLKAPFNFFVVQFSKLSVSMKITRFMFRRLLGMTIGKDVNFSPIEIDPLCPDLISIGDGSAIGWKTTILCHGFTQECAKFGKVDIGKNVLIGANSTIGPGVTIGDNAIVAMSSLIIKDIPANELWGGNPAKKIKTLNKKDRMNYSFISRVSCVN